MANFSIQKTTAGAANRNVGDVITSTVVIRNTTLFYDHVDQQETTMNGWVQQVATVAPGQTNAALNGMEFQNVGAIAALDGTLFEGNLGSSLSIRALSFTTDSGSSAGADFTLRVYDGSTNASPLLATFAGDAGSQVVGPFTQNQFHIELERTGGAENELLLQSIIQEQGLNVPVNISDIVPASPAGTTRTWTAVHSRNNALLSSTAGVGDIAMVAQMRAGDDVTLTINDTVTAAGTYQNSATISGAQVVGVPSPTDTGQQVTVAAVVTTPPGASSVTLACGVNCAPAPVSGGAIPQPCLC